MGRVKIGGIAKLYRGVSYKKEQAKKIPCNDYVAILRANNITSGIFNFDDLVYLPLELVSQEQYINQGDIVITMSSGSKTHVGKVAIAKRSMRYSYGAFCAKIVPTGVLPKFLYYVLRSAEFRTHIEQQCKGTNINNIKQSYILDYEIALPSALEQEHIVARIEELFSQLDSGVETLKKAKQQLAVYRQAVLKEAFDKYHDFVPLGQISERIFDGPFGSHLKTADYTNDGIRVVRLENIKSGWFDDSKQSYVSPDKYETICTHTVFPSDLIMSTFLSESIKICQLPQSIKFAVNKADCVGIRLKNDIQPNFIMFYLLSRQAYVALIHQVHGATRPRVNTKQIKAILVPFANGDMQEETVAEVERKLSICDSIEQTVNTALQQAEAVRQSILKQAFEGGLL